jgi:serine/threonine protein phosphatase PrpC
VSEATQLRCGACSASIQEGDRFCEQCGARFGEEEEGGCRACGAPAAEIGEDGYCSVCGLRARGAEARVELDLLTAAVVSDMGRVHRRNEDAFHLEIVEGRDVAVVVCDGISSASAGDVAAQSAAQAAGSFLVDALAGRENEIPAAMIDAVRAANEAVGQVPWTARVDRALPSCTLVGAVWRDRDIVVGWVGDSRAYWLGQDSRQLTIDDSWAEEQVAEGLLTIEEASKDPRLHSITHWVGADAPPRPPRVVSIRPESPGRLLLCTDGLWNYAPSSAELAGLIDALPPGAAPAAVARSLTDTALTRGGRDNITVAVIDIEPS